MEVEQFLSELGDEITKLDFAKHLIVVRRSVNYIKIKVILKPKGFLNIWYNAVKRTQAFTLLIENKRVWGLDYDNNIGWHEHPIDNQKLHIIIKSHTITEIINKLKIVWNNIN